MKEFSMRLLTTATALLLITFLFTNCKSGSNLTTNQLAGTWQETEPEGIIQMAGSGHQFKFFENKTFQLEQRKWTDAINASDPFV